MKQFLIIVVGVLLLNAALLYSGGFAYIQQQFAPEPAEPSLPPDVIETFKNTLESEVRQQLGTPIEGYEPQMFLDTFPGLVESDFDGVEASIGFYRMENGRLTHVMDDSQLIHSAAQAITRRGMITLYHNIAARIGIDPDNGGTLTKVMDSIVRHQEN